MDSSAPPPPNPNGNSEQKPAAADNAAAPAPTNGADAASKQEPSKEPEETPLPDDILNASPEDIMTRVRLIDNDLKVSAHASSLADINCPYRPWKLAICR